jgi:D-xylose transport system substrate-binding protein
VTAALYLRAGQSIPSSIANQQINNQTGNIPAVLLTPVSVTASNMEQTVVADGFDTAAQICTGSFASVCQQDGIK